MLVLPLLFFSPLLSTVGGFEHPLPATSQCADAFGKWNMMDYIMTNGTFKSVFFLPPSPNPTLKTINVGFGTTGTHTVADYDRTIYKISCHWSECMNRSYENRLVGFFKIVRQCVIDRKRSAKCLTKPWWDALRPQLQNMTVNGIESVGDNPIGIYFREFLDMVPNLIIKHTVRDPFIWTLKRVAEHIYVDLMCDPSLAQNKMISNPFSILECMEHSVYVFDNLINMKDYMHITPDQAASYVEHPPKIPPATRTLIDHVSAFYMDFNQRVLNTVRSAGLAYEAVCVWDGNYPPSADNSTITTVESV